MVLPKIETYPLFRCVSGFIMDWIPYMDTVAKIPKTGVVLVKNLFVASRFSGFWGTCKSAACQFECLLYFRGNCSEMGRI